MNLDSQDTTVWDTTEWVTQKKQRENVLSITSKICDELCSIIFTLYTLHHYVIHKGRKKSIFWHTQEETSRGETSEREDGRTTIWRARQDQAGNTKHERSLIYVLQDRDETSRTWRNARNRYEDVQEMERRGIQSEEVRKKQSIRIDLDQNRQRVRRWFYDTQSIRTIPQITSWGSSVEPCDLYIYFIFTPCRLWKKFIYSQEWQFM